MLRRLLAFLALLTGCAAFYAPAQAAVESTASVSLQRAPQADTAPHSARIARVRHPVGERRRVPQFPASARPSYAAVTVPTILLGPDRARE